MDRIQQWLMEPLAPLVLVIALVALIVLALMVIALVNHLGRRDRATDEKFQRIEAELGRRVERAAEQGEQQSQRSRDELMGNLRGIGDGVARQVSEMQRSQQTQLDQFAVQMRQISEQDERRMDEIRRALESRLLSYQDSMERMGEQLALGQGEPEPASRLLAPLEQRLREAEQQLDNIDAMAQDGGMSELLQGVIEQRAPGRLPLMELIGRLLHIGQYEADVKLRPGALRCECAISLPGDGRLLLPVHSFEPDADHQQGELLLQALREAAEQAALQFIAPPLTTDFAIVYLPTEALYGRAVQSAGQLERIQRELRVSIAGPSTMAALIRSLLAGCKTAQLERQSREVRQILGLVRGEVSTFSESLQKAEKRIRQAGSALEDAAKASRVIQKKLKGVDKLSRQQKQALLQGEDAPYDLADWD